MTPATIADVECQDASFIQLPNSQPIKEGHMDGRSDGRNARLAVLRKNNEEVFSLIFLKLSLSTFLTVSSSSTSLCNVGATKAATGPGQTDVQR